MLSKVQDKLEMNDARMKQVYNSVDELGRTNHKIAPAIPLKPSTNTSVPPYQSPYHQPPVTTSTPTTGTTGTRNTYQYSYQYQYQYPQYPPQNQPTQYPPQNPSTQYPSTQPYGSGYAAQPAYTPYSSSNKTQNTQKSSNGGMYYLY